MDTLKLIINLVIRKKCFRFPIKRANAIQHLGTLLDGWNTSGTNATTMIYFYSPLKLTMNLQICAGQVNLPYALTFFAKLQTKTTLVALKSYEGFSLIQYMEGTNMDERSIGPL